MLSCIAAYHDEHGNYPYLVMNSKMAEKYFSKKYGIIKASENSNMIYDNSSMIYDASSIASKKQYPQTITIDNKEYSCVMKELAKWENCKIVIDDDLEFGEIYIK